MAPSFRLAEDRDIGVLTSMNRGLIRDSGHRNELTDAELLDRMGQFLRSEYTALIGEIDESPVCYALYKHDPEFLYIRQLYVTSNHRRSGIGTHMVNWIAEHNRSAKRLRMDILVCNTNAIAFWRSVGFCDYCLTLERSTD